MISQINIGACPRQNAVCEHYSEKGCCVYGLIEGGLTCNVKISIMVVINVSRGKNRRESRF